MTVGVEFLVQSRACEIVNALFYLAQWEHGPNNRFEGKSEAYFEWYMENESYVIVHALSAQMRMYNGVDQSVGLHIFSFCFRRGNS